MHRLYLLWSLTVLPVCIPAAEQTKAAQAKKDNAKPESSAEVSEWARRTEGHRPQDQNGDGRISRNEWPGNDESFRRLDRNRDGVITDADRKLEPKDGSVHNEANAGSKKR